MRYSIRIPREFGINMETIGYVRKTLRNGGYPTGLSSMSSPTNAVWGFETGDKPLDDKTAESLRQITRHNPTRLDVRVQSE